MTRFAFRAAATLALTLSVAGCGGGGMFSGSNNQQTTRTQERRESTIWDLFSNNNDSNKVVAVVGDNPDRKEWASNPVPRENWHAAIFTAPHGCAWGANGDLYVQDWNKTGRLTKMERVKP